MTISDHHLTVPIGKSTPGDEKVPTYAYTCTACGHAFDIHQSFSDEALTVCPECSGRLRKVFSPVGVVFKGSGFYRNDARSGGKGGRVTKDSSTTTAPSTTVGAGTSAGTTAAAGSSSTGSSTSATGSSTSSSSSSGSGSSSSGSSSAAKAASA